MLENEFHFDHSKCELLKFHDYDVVKYYIDNGIFVNLRRRFYSNKILHPEHPRTAKYYRSEASKKEEQARHLTNHPWTIHPCSKFNLVWELVMFFTYFYLIFLYSLKSLFLNETENYFYVNVAKLFGEVFYVMDFFFRFFEGYYDGAKSKAVLNLQSICLRYIKSFFIFDLVAFIPFAFFIKDFIMNTCVNKTLLFLNICTFTGLCRFVRVQRFLDALELIKDIREFSDYTFNAIKSIVLYILIMLLLHSVMFVGNCIIDGFYEVSFEPNVGRDYLSATLILCLVSQGIEPLYNMMVDITVILGFFFGFCVYLYLHVECFQVWNKFYSARRRYEELMQQVKQYMTFKGLPFYIKEKIWLYFNFKYQNKFFNERDINLLLSNAIKEEVMMNLADNFLTQATFLKNLPPLILHKIVTSLISEVYLTDDVIIAAGHEAESMYFIYYGTVAVYDSNHKEICHLKDGDCFGEEDMYFERKRSHYVVAVTPCEVFMLKKSSVIRVFAEYPQLKSDLLDGSQEHVVEDVELHRFENVKRPSV